MDLKLLKAFVARCRPWHGLEGRRLPARHAAGAVAPDRQPRAPGGLQAVRARRPQARSHPARRTVPRRMPRHARHASIFDQRAQELRRGDLQLLRIAAPALTIEALFPDFMGRYADRVPAYASSCSTSRPPTISTCWSAARPTFRSTSSTWFRSTGSALRFTCCRASTCERHSRRRSAWRRARSIDIRRARRPAAARARHELCHPQCVRRRLSSRRLPAQHLLREPFGERAAGDCCCRARHRHHSLGAANRSGPAADAPRHSPRRAAGTYSRRSSGTAAARPRAMPSSFQACSPAISRTPIRHRP